MFKISHEDTWTYPKLKLKRKVATGLKRSCDIFVYFIHLISVNLIVWWTPLTMLMSRRKV
jgi:hypothetical protein